MTTPPHAGSMATNTLGRRMRDNVSTKLDGLGEVAAHTECVVDDEGCTMLVTDVCDLPNIWDVLFWIRDGLDVNTTRLLVNCLVNQFGVVTLYKLDINVEFLHIHPSCSISPVSFIFDIHGICTPWSYLNWLYVPPYSHDVDTKLCHGSQHCVKAMNCAA